LIIVIFVQHNSPLENQNNNTGVKTALLGVVINLFFALLKGAAGFLGNSYALVADATESMADVFTSGIVALGLKVSSKAPDDDHPYGHGKVEPAVSVVVSLALLVSAILIAVGGVNRMLTPHQGPAVFTIIVLMAVIVIKEILFRYEYRKGNELNSPAMKADAWHHRSDVITSFTALVGISIALIGGKKYADADAWAALVASLIIAFNSFKIFNPAFKELMDTAPPKDITKEIIAIARAVDGVVTTEKCHVRKMGRYYYVDLHVMVNENLSVKEGHAIAHHVKDNIVEAGINVYDVLVHIEPAKTQRSSYPK
jgi:cation diffusion facilitator family transporter